MIEMRVQVLFFGLLREVTGSPAEGLEVPESATLGDVAGVYAARYAEFRALGRNLLMARNQEFAGAGTPLAEGDEIAFLPPVARVWSTRTGTCSS
jgi:molybdopterin synthase catalytic subunit